MDRLLQDFLLSLVGSSHQGPLHQVLRLPEDDSMKNKMGLGQSMDIEAMVDVISTDFWRSRGVRLHSELQPVCSIEKSTTERTMKNTLAIHRFLCIECVPQIKSYEPILSLFSSYLLQDIPKSIHIIT